MTIRRLSWRGFRVPFARPFETARGSHAAREGLLLRVELADGAHGLGECSPLPGFGGGRLGDCLVVLRAWAGAFVEVEPEIARLQLLRLSEQNTHVPALVAGLDAALLDAEARRRGVPVAGLLCDGHGAAVPVNATVAARAVGAAAEQASLAVEAGFRCVKLKVGLEPSVDAELARLRAVRAAIGPAVELRVDANGAWSRAGAVALLRRAEDLDIRLVEQPVPADDLAGMAWVRARVGQSIAADESVTGPASAEAVVAAGAADVLVVKPTVAGGLRAGRRIVEQARAAGLGAIVTSTLETGVGLAAALQLAATLPAPAPACGLATGALLESDLLDAPLRPAGGELALPDAPGLGVALDEAALARYDSGLCGEAGP